MSSADLFRVPLSRLREYRNADWLLPTREDPATAVSEWTEYVARVLAGSLAALDAAEVAQCLKGMFPNTAPEAFERWTKIRTAGADDSREPLCEGESGRLALGRVRHPGLWKLKKKMEKLMWDADKVSLEGEGTRVESLKAELRQLIRHVLAFFAIADTLVCQGIDEVFARKIKLMEAQFYFAAQLFNETIHNEAYTLQVNAAVPLRERQEVYDAVKTFRAVGAMADWIRFWIWGSHALTDQLVVGAYNEGVMFSSQFAIIKWFQNGSTLKGIPLLNDWISRDEALHASAFCFLISDKLAIKPADEVVSAVAREVLALCAGFIRDALPVDIPEFSRAELADYTRHVSDNVMDAMGFSRLLENETARPNPLPYMEKLMFSATERKNFFEDTSTAYQRLGPGALEFGVEDGVLD